MKIKNLGPIKEANIDLSRMLVFVGDNGLGKTLVAYSIFALRNWLERDFQPQLVTESQIRDMILEHKVLNLPTKATIERVIQEIKTAFNGLNQASQPNYFQDFFRDDAVYQVGRTRIEIDDDDIRSFLLPSDERQGWLYRWTFNLQKHPLTEEGPENRILTMSTAEMSTSHYTFRQDNGGETPAVDLAQQVPTDMTQAIYYVSRNICNNLFDFSATNTYLPAERIGINVFRTKLNTQIVDDNFASPVSAVDAAPIRRGIAGERYPYPIESYLKFLNNSLGGLTQPYNSQLVAKIPAPIEQLIPGAFRYDDKLDQIKYHIGDQDVGFNLVSSSLKSLFGVDLFLRQPSLKNWLFIDEPEMNLHPIRQRLIADILYELLLAGTRLVISTHSDYFIKELVNRNLKQRLEDRPQPGLRIYEFKANQVVDLGVGSENTDFTNFDQTTDQINDDYYQLLDQLAEKEDHLDE